MSVGEVLRDILVVLVAAKVAAELAERAAMPAVVGEIVAGILIGPSVLGLVGEDAVLRVLGQLGVILLLLEVGLQLDLRDLRAVGRASVLVASAGVAVPFVLGAIVVGALGHHGHTALFLGAALTATSVGVTARVFSDLRAITSVEARTVLGAAVVDDVMGLVILTVVLRVVNQGSVSPLAIAGITGLAMGFLVVTTSVGVRLTPPLFHLVDRLSRTTGTLVAIALAFSLAFAELATVVKLAPIVGAFVAGLSLGRSAPAERIRRDLAPVGHLFIPVFFLQIGIDVRVHEFARPAVLGLAAALLVVAVVGKLAAAVGMIGSPGDKPLVAIGMLPRGEVGLIFATLGLRGHILSQELYASLLLAILCSDLVTPTLLRWRIRTVRAARRRHAVPTSMPPGGWLGVDDGTFDLAAEPPDHLALPVALDAALLAARARPGPRLLAWLEELGPEPLRWDDAARERLFRVLRAGNARSWRFLEMSGVLDRAVPELARALARRRADPFELDPTHAMRWPLVERLTELVATDERAAAEHARLLRPEWLLLAAVILDAAGEDSAVTAARRLVERLDLGAAAEEEVALLVRDNRLLASAAARLDADSEESVLQLAGHLDRPERARALYLLTLAQRDFQPWERQRLDHLHEVVQEALSHPEMTGLDARNLVERRRAEASRLAPGTASRRIADAPRAYVLTTDSETIARHAALLEPLPARGRARVTVQPTDDPSRWELVVASRDQRGLLAIVTRALRQADLDVEEATVATWPDGAALESFCVRSPAEPDAAALAAAIEAGFSVPLQSPPIPDARVTFDDTSSPWYTRCEVRAPDRPGLLHALAAAFAAAGADVHGAKVSTSGGEARDEFELSDRHRRKLDEPAKDAVRAAIGSGVVTRGRRWLPNAIGTRPKHRGDRSEIPVP